MAKYICSHCQGIEFRGCGSDYGLALYNDVKHYYFCHPCKACGFPLYILTTKDFDSRFAVNPDDFEIIKPSRNNQTEYED